MLQTWSRRCVLGIVGASLAGGLGGCQTLEEALRGVDRPTADLRSAQLTGLTADAAQLRFDVEVSNPYAFDLPLTNLSYALGSGGATLLSGQIDDPPTVPASDSIVVPVNATLPFASALRLLQGVRPGQVIPYTADLQLALEPPGMAPVNLPLQHKGQLPIPAVPEVSLASIDWEALSLSRAEAVLNLDVTNTNQFDLDLSALTFDLALGGTPIVSSTATADEEFDPGERERVRVPISFAPASLGTAVYRMLTGSAADYRMDGRLDLGTPFGPLELPYTAAGRTALTQ